MSKGFVKGTVCDSSTQARILQICVDFNFEVKLLKYQCKYNLHLWGEKKNYWGILSLFGLLDLLKMCIYMSD